MSIPSCPAGLRPRCRPLSLSSASFISRREIASLSGVEAPGRGGRCGLVWSSDSEERTLLWSDYERSLFLSLLGVRVRPLGSAPLLAATPLKFLSDIRFTAWKWWTHPQMKPFRWKSQWQSVLVGPGTISAKIWMKCRRINRGREVNTQRH